MALRTEDFPQADRLESVAKVALAVHDGKDSDQAIEKYIGLASESRQGRYYRKAAELLDLIATKNNRSSLTSRGREYVALTNDADRRSMLAVCLARNELFRELGTFIHEAKPTPEQLIARIIKLYPGAENTARRRASSIINYIQYARMGTLKAGVFNPGEHVGSAIVRRKLAAEGLTGTKPRADLPDEGTGGMYTFSVDSAKLERANLAHQKLVAAKALFLHGLGLESFENEQVDLFTTKPAADTIIYEMKSISEINFRSQMRRAVSQLFEYRYFFNTLAARLCVVTNKKPVNHEADYVQYLEDDRAIAYAWSEDYKRFFCSPSSSKLLNGFAP